MSSSATIRRAPRRSMASATAGWSSPRTPDRATAPASVPAVCVATTVAARPGCSSGSSVSGLYVGAARPRRRQTARSTPLTSSRSNGRMRPVPRRLLGRPGQGDREAPPLADDARVVAVALADLEDRDVLPATAEVRRRDLDQAADDRPAKDRVVGESGFVTRIARPPAGVPPATAAVSAVQAKRSAWLDGDERMADGLAQPGAGEGASRTRSRTLQRRVAEGGHRRVRQDVGNRLVAADANDLLGHIGLDRDVASPGRNDRHEQRLRPDVVDRQGHGTRRRPARAGRQAASVAGSDPMPTRSRRVALLADGEVRPEQTVDPGRSERDAGRLRLRSGRCRRGRGRRCRRPTPRPAARHDRRRSGQAASPGPSRTGGWPRIGGRSADRSGG